MTGRRLARALLPLAGCLRLPPSEARAQRGRTVEDDGVFAWLEPHLGRGDPPRSPE